MWKRLKEVTGKNLLKIFSDQNSTNSSYRIAAQKLANELGTPEISILSTIIGVVASTKKIIKNKNFEKNPCEKKKGRGAKLSGQKFRLYRRLGGVRHFPDHRRRK